jgi:hypothetical protein
MAPTLIDKNIKCRCGAPYLKNGRESRFIMTSGGKINLRGQG